MTQINKSEPLSFNGLGIDPKILDIIRHLNFTIPTPIQLKSIPVIAEGKDMVGIAQTGTGKTLAFGIPMLQRLSKYKGRCLILVPTRELASQVNDHLKIIAQKLNFKTVVLIGGESKYPQIKSLQRRPELIIATPGRLIDYLESKTFNLNEVKCLILDEADLMFDMGFAPQLNKILKLSPKEKQTILFSATMPSSIMEIATKHMSLPVRIEVAPAGTPAENVIQEVIILHKEDRTVQLQKILSEYKGSVLIFVRTKSSVKNICRNISNMKHTVAEIHSNRTLVQRTRALRGFKEGQFRILVATDIAARGIDVKGIELVLNYDLPDNIEDYIHRIGRTGRAGKMGQAISFATPSQITDVRRIERIIKKEIPLTKLVEIKNEGKNFNRDNRSSGFQTFRGHRKNNNRPTHNYQDKKWNHERKSTSGYQSDYDRFKKSKEQPAVGGDS
ncbi:MAG: DEAD/DEAH box helicase, partial [Patescibacteria group bacterium]